MAGERVERDQIVLRDPTGWVMSDVPIHFAGMAVFMRNDSNSPATFRIHESENGTVWSLVLFSTHNASALASLTIAPLSFAVALFTSAEQFVRLSLADENQAGVYCSLVQYPPKGLEDLPGY